MLITFRLAWCKAETPLPRAFRLPAAAQLVAEYAVRIRTSYCPCEVRGAASQRENRPDGRLWVCDRQAPKALTSAELAGALGQVAASGVSRLNILIGGPDGFSTEDIARLKPDLRWSFGPLTFPHELAAVIAAEQIYRAWTILRNAPYHLGH